MFKLCVTFVPYLFKVDFSMLKDNYFKIGFGLMNLVKFTQAPECVCQVVCRTWEHVVRHERLVGEVMDAQWTLCLS